MTAEAAPPAGRRRRVIEVAITVGFIAFLGVALARQWPRVEDVIGQLSAAAIALSTTAVLIGTWCSLLCWRAILADFGSRVPLAGGMRIFFIGQAGKYVPGKVWPILTQIRIGRDYQVPRRSSAAAAVVFMIIVLGSGLLVGVGSLPALGTDAVGQYWWALLVLPIAAIALWPPVLNWALARAMRLARREPMPQPLSAAGILRAVGWALVMWLLYGVHLWVLLSALDASAPDLPFRSVTIFAAAWSIGFLLLVAPAGVGPRELALVALLASTVTQPVAIVVAVVSRLLMTLVDLAWAVLAVVVASRWRAVAARPGGDR